MLGTDLPRSKRDLVAAKASVDMFSSPGEARR